MGLYDCQSQMSVVDQTGAHILHEDALLSPQAQQPRHSGIDPSAWAAVQSFEPQAQDDDDSEARVLSPSGGSQDDAARVRDIEVPETQEDDDLDDPSIPDGLLAFGFCRSCHSSSWKEAASFLRKGRARGAFDVDTPDEQGYTPLAIATRARNMDVIKGIITEGGADPNAVSTDALLTPLHYATMLQSSYQTMELLLRSGADPDAASSDGTTPVHIAALNGNVEQLEILLGPLGNGDPNGQRHGKGGATPLYCAAFQGHVDAATSLLKYGALVDLYKEGGFTPLFVAAEQNQVPMVKLLLAAHADVNTRDYRKATPLFIACVSNHVEVVRVLVSHPNLVVDYNGASGGITATYISAELGRTECLKLLMTARPAPQPNKPNKFGATALHIACENGHTDAAKVLLCNGWDRHVAVMGPRKWLTPAYFAAQNGHWTTLHTLIWWRGPQDDVLSLESSAVLSESGSESGHPPAGAAKRAVSEKVAAAAGAAFVGLLSQGKPGSKKSRGATSMSAAAVTAALTSEPCVSAVESATMASPPPPPNQAALVDPTAAPYKGERQFHRRYLEKPLFAACRKGHDKCVRVLLAAGTNPDAIREDNRHTPLYTAALNGHNDVMSSLILGGADPNKPDKMGVTPLLRAVRSGAAAVVSFLAKSGAVIGAEDPNSGRQPLHEAAESGNSAVVETLLELGARINAQDFNGQTPLAAAIIARRVECGKLLLQRGADATLTDKYGNSPLYAACKCGVSGLVTAVLAAPGVNGNKEYLNRLNKTDVATPLYAAAKANAPGCVSELIRARADLNLADADGNTPLMIAAKLGHEEVAELLLTSGANPACLTPMEKYTALHYSAAGGFDGIVRALIAAKASKDTQTTTGELTPLLMAMMARHTSTLNLLLDLGASPSISDASGMTTLHFAVQLNDLALLRRLLSVPDVVNAINAQRRPDRCTPLFLACQLGLYDAVQLLMELPDSGIRVDLRNAMGATPLFIASQEGFTDIVKYLLTKGADPNAIGMPPENVFPLFVASLAGHASTVQALLLGGALLNMVTASGASAFHAACSEQQLSVAIVLLRAGIDYMLRAVDGRTGLEIAKKFGHNQFVSGIKPLIRTMAKEAKEADDREKREREREERHKRDAEANADEDD